MAKTEVKKPEVDAAGFETLDDAGFADFEKGAKAGSKPAAKPAEKAAPKVAMPPKAAPKAEPAVEPAEPAEEPVAEPAQAAAPEVPEAPVEKQKKRALSPTAKLMQKAVDKVLRKAGLTALPEADALLSLAEGQKTAIKDVAIFSSEPQDELLKLIQTEVPTANTVNLKGAGIDLRHVRDVIAQVLSDGHLLHPIQVAKVEDGTLQVTSGRHRLIGLALVYGAKQKVPMLVTEMPLVTARDVVVRANSTRGIGAMERAEHCVLSALKGDLSQDLAAQYEHTVRTKGTMKRFVTFHVVSREEMAKLEFTAGEGVSARKAGALTTYGGLEAFWGNAIQWTGSMEFAKFEKLTKDAVAFLNDLVEELQDQADFKPDQHLASQALAAVGSYYASLLVAKQDPQKRVEDIAKALVSLSDIGRKRSDDIKEKLVEAIG